MRIREVRLGGGGGGEGRGLVDAIAAITFLPCRMQQECECDRVITGVYNALGKGGNVVYWSVLPKLTLLPRIFKTPLLVMYFPSFLSNSLPMLSKHSIIC